MSKVKEFIITKSNELIDCIDKHSWIVPTAILGVLGALGINELGNHNAMEHDYERSCKLGPLVISVRKSLPDNPGLPDADGGQPLNK